MRVCTSCGKVLKADANPCPADGAPSEAVETLPRGARLGAYRIERVLGEGGMGSVYEAIHEVLNRRTAIKMLRPELARHPQSVTRFLNEAKAVNLIDHPNIVSVYDYGDDQDGSVYFVMELLEGETLDDLMRRRRPMSPPLLLHLFGQLARALAAAHAKQIVHRDLKPANVYLVAREGNPYFVKLLDFGIAQLRGAGAVSGLTAAGQLLGTPQYMSPEQLSGGLVDARSDLWAVGVMLYRAATGEAPFRADDFAALADRILHGEPRPASELLPLAPSLARLISSCLERRLEARCPSVAELVAGLESVKVEYGLDDGAILAAAAADTRALDRELRESPAVPHDLTRESMAGSIPRYQGAAQVAGATSAGARRGSWLGWYVMFGAAVVGLGGGFYRAVRSRAGAGHQARSAGDVKRGSADGVTAPTTIRTAAGADLPAARGLAERHLRDAIMAGSLQQQGFAVDAIGLARATKGAPLLYQALKGSPEVRVKAARALGELALPDAAPKLRAALDESGPLLKVDLSAELYRLGDKDVRAILVRALERPSQRLTAAAAMADVGDAGGRAALVDVLAAVPAGREPWRRAAGGLVQLGDPHARSLLDGELAQPDAARSVGAAEVLARRGDGKARALLTRLVSDPDFARRGDAALALARLGDRRALAWVGEGLESADVGERTLALAVCGVLAGDATVPRQTIATLAINDPDLSVRMTAEAVLLGL